MDEHINLPPPPGEVAERSEVGEGLGGTPSQSPPAAVPAPPKGEPSSYFLSLLFFILPPILLTILFYALADNAALMDAWVHKFLAPFIHTVGKFWAVFPFSVAELFTVLFIASSVLWLLRAAVLLVKKRKLKPFLRRVLAYVCLLSWLWCAFCWMWNCTYRAPGFAEKNGFSSAPYTPDQLLETAVIFALRAAELAPQVPRNEDLSFAVTPAESFERGVTVYDNLTKLFPSLELSHRRAKPILFSRLQSYLGYTGVYFPFTGEANVNIDQIPALIPFTIAHEMAHQRMVASEDECNFVGILACITSEDVIFQYSGWLMGLTYLINAIYDISPELAHEIMRQGFNDELRKDWDDNYEYWQALRSPARDKASEAMDEVYDGYLKSQGQTLGLMSYDACVDLLVNYFS